jgi:MFS transporter, MHS family, proline/betaine transporter
MTQVTSDRPRLSLATVGSILLGHVLELYDTVVYGYLATYLAHFYFPTHDVTLQLLEVYGVLLISYLVRPCGAYFFGKMADKRGRKPTLLISLYCLTLATFSIGCLPTYAVLGVYASVLLLLAKCVQGFAFGGEYTCAIIYLLEMAPIEKRKQWASMVLVGSQFGWLVGALVCYYVIHVVGAVAFNQGYWRLVFLVGGFGGVIGLYWRRHLTESPVLTQLKSGKNPLTLSGWKRSVLVCQFMGLCSLYLVFVYITSVFEVNHLLTWRHFSLESVLLYSIGAHVSMILFIPLLGLIIDQLNLARLLYWSIGLACVFVFPYLWALDHGAWWQMGVSKLLFFVPCVGISFLPIEMVCCVPLRVRGQLSALSFHLAASIFGGTTPIIALYLTSKAHTSLMVGVWFCAVALLSGLMVYYVSGHLLDESS